MATYTLIERIFDSKNRLFMGVRTEGSYNVDEEYEIDEISVKSKDSFGLVEEFYDKGYRLRRGDRVTTIPQMVNTIREYIDIPTPPVFQDNFVVYFSRKTEEERRKELEKIPL